MDRPFIGKISDMPIYGHIICCCYDSIWIKHLLIYQGAFSNLFSHIFSALTSVYHGIYEYTNTICLPRQLSLNQVDMHLTFYSASQLFLYLHNCYIILSVVHYDSIILMTYCICVLCSFDYFVILEQQL